MIKTVTDSNRNRIDKPYKDYRPDEAMLAGWIRGGDRQWLVSKKAEGGIYEVTSYHREGSSIIGPFKRKAGSALEAMVAEANSRTKGEEAELILDPVPDWLKDKL